MMKQYMSKVTEFFKAPMTNGMALGTAAVAVMASKRDLFMEQLATKKKEYFKEEKSATGLKENVVEADKKESAADVKENAV
ncbi:hypothetical protein AtNW77_Chr3g0185361 [Arabidopsis thaliana]|uniref:Uncharacterized protein n=4 Tax=Arabidopsis TaxID=3701 RepID=Q1G3A6_ARATH|nr:uncharacterized protein AT3G25577 [Arabidopsis thaliana]KAG7626549.1 hypothetical protein ISN45_At03g026960 [Arabidopsis thaliana x Arabidopsis arenosa]KAG7632534.1 hypothetical protein ISN44_As03g026660 [Arabidopsis suecica]ABF59268.1 unknown protein [Arabidopsis thaliana]AEE77033.1 hypothetical protein AT3G25577 [Arabidopsis thaliana]OAP04986.1 hypothetical protein AXX17_AT3G27540 [Arabidopsis thaliana]|eukprot:NP_001118699.1 hypothetical protein AT3G25577 [Arabidopsis thaliana]